MADAYEPSPQLRAILERLQQSETTPDEQAIIDNAIAWLDEKWKDEVRCPYCGADHWDVGAPIRVPLQFIDGNLLLVPVTCQNCKQTTLLNAIAAELLPPVE